MNPKSLWESSMYSSTMYGESKEGSLDKAFLEVGSHYPWLGVRKGILVLMRMYEREPLSRLVLSSLSLLSEYPSPTERTGASPFGTDDMGL